MIEIAKSATSSADAIRFWWWFWTASFVLSGVCFFSVAFLVLYRGLGEIKQMIMKAGSDG